MISDRPVPGSWSGWNAVGAQKFLTPLSGGSGYPQNLGARTLRCQITFRFASRYPDSTIDNYFLLMDIIARQPNTPREARLRFRDLEGWTRPVQVMGYPAEPGEVGAFASERSHMASVYDVPLTLVVPGYIADDEAAG